MSILGMLVSLLVLAPAAPAQATTRPVLIVGGHGSQSEDLEELLADYLDDPTRLNLSDEWVRGVELATEPGWNLPFDSPDAGDWPGTASNEISAVAIHEAIDDLYLDAGNVPVDVIAISQGAVAARWLLQDNPSNVRSKVAGYISLSGVNPGIPDTSSIPLLGFLLDECEDEEWLVMCEEMIYDTPLQQPGQAEWMEAEVNQAEYTVLGPITWGDPTPAGTGETTPGIAYFHIYTENNPDTVEATETEAIRPYDWPVPLLGASNRSAQDDCGSSYEAPHIGWTLDWVPDPVMEHLLLDALKRNLLDAPSSLC